MSDDNTLLRDVYDELRALAANKLAGEAAGQTLTPTALVHEAYLRLASASVAWKNRQHFFSLAATAMRRILVDRARARLSLKRGGNLKRVPLDDVAIPVADDVISQLDLALSQLSELKPQHAQLIELRFFGGLSGDEAAEVLGVSPASADRMWRYARSWLGAAIAENKSD